MTRKKPSTAQPDAKEPTLPPRPRRRGGLRRWVLRQVLRLVFWVIAVVIVLLLALRTVNPPTTPYMLSEARRLGAIDHQWVPISDIAPVMLRAAVAAEDANFCTHFGFDMAAIRAAISQGANRGASTISQQTVKNLVLWQGRSWSRKVLEALLTPLLETLWPKSRILEVYLNIIEFDAGVFGIDAAAYHYFKTSPDRLTARQAALLAAVLPNPKGRDAARPDARLNVRAASIIDGAATLRADGRAACFDG